MKAKVERRSLGGQEARSWWLPAGWIESASEREREREREFESNQPKERKKERKGK